MATAHSLRTTGCSFWRQLVCIHILSCLFSKLVEKVGKQKFFYCSTFFEKSTKNFVGQKQSRVSASFFFLLNNDRLEECCPTHVFGTRGKCFCLYLKAKVHNPSFDFKSAVKTQFVKSRFPFYVFFEFYNEIGKTRSFSPTGRINAQSLCIQ